MPRAKDNRKPVGTEHCHKCGCEAEFFQVQRGPKLGYLYRKGCDCKADQRTLPYVQLEWLNRMTRTPHPMVQHPLTLEGATPAEPAEKPQPEPVHHEPEPRASTEGNPKTDTKKTGLIGLALLVGSVAVAIFT